MKPAVAVLGASGQVGLFAIAGLLEAGREVIAVTRRAAHRTDTDIEGLSRCGQSQLIERLSLDPVSGAFALLSCGPAALADTVLESVPSCEGRIWERVVIVGTTSIQSKQSSPDEAERRVVGGIAAEIAAIRRRCENDGIPLAVLNPTLIYGCGMDQNLSRVWRWVRRTGFAPLAAEAGGLRQPVHVADLADTLVRAVELEPAPELDTVVCGGSSVEYREMIGMLFDAAGRKRRFLRLPPAAFGLATGVVRLLPGAAGVNPEMFRRQSRDLVFDDSPARERLGHAPRPYRPIEADFGLPSPVERIRDALLE